MRRFLGRRRRLSDDPIIRNHLALLYDTLLEQNLVRIIKPYSRVEIAHVAELVGQPRRDVENKLSQIILDKVFHGILDQGAGCLIVFDEPEEDKPYQATLATILASNLLSLRIEHKDFRQPFPRRRFRPHVH